MGANSISIDEVFETFRLNSLNTTTNRIIKTTVVIRDIFRQFFIYAIYKKEGVFLIKVSLLAN